MSKLQIVGFKIYSRLMKASAIAAARVDVGK